MRQFWVYGYEATSMDDLVRATGVGRSAIYKDFGGKKDLFLACLNWFRDASVTPAFAVVEAEGAGFPAIRTYLRDGVVGIEKMGLPGRGCLMGNTLTELGPHDTEIAEVVHAHYDRLTNGFALALANETGRSAADIEIRELAGFLAISVQGLWSYARGTESIDSINKKAEILIELMELKLAALSGKARTL